MKTILVPTDFSKNAANALSYAINWAKKEKAKIVLLHAFNVPYVSPDVPMEFFSEQLSVTEEGAEKLLMELANKVKKAKIKCEAVNIKGIPIDVIRDTVKKKKINLVIMGTRGAGKIKELLIGSNTAKVIARSSCPVIAVPEKASYDGIKKIVYATDYHSSDVAAIKELVRFAEVFKSRIKILHIAEGEYTLESEEEYKEQFAQKIIKKINYKNISCEVLYATGIEKKLEGYLKKESIDLLAVSTRRRNFIERLFEKSITKKLVYHTKIPLIAFHYKQNSVIFI